MAEGEFQIPRIIWFMWLQGLTSAPKLVQKCYESWRKHNPEWRLVLLDQSTLDDWINIRNELDLSRTVPNAVKSFLET